ncbi:hypothetical protein V502_01515 [Pseudogymnoascus sp. VKM F-4520 (FW-2644)]|nr:hypothetical protein V502_01515 [Pseudogymnoascus sp. VKM F-4520 (FW-2644)]
MNFYTISVENESGKNTTYAAFMEPPQFTSGEQPWMNVWYTSFIPYHGKFDISTGIDYYAWVGTVRTRLGPGELVNSSMNQLARLGSESNPGSTFDLKINQSFPTIEQISPSAVAGAYEIQTGIDFNVPNGTYLVGLAKVNNRGQVAPVASISPRNNEKIQITPKMKFFVTESHQVQGEIVDYTAVSRDGATIDFSSGAGLDKSYAPLFPVKEFTVKEEFWVTCPASIPYNVQHLILTTTQRLLEECCFGFAAKWAPALVEDKGWDCAEVVELTLWTKTLARLCDKLPADAISNDSEIPLRMVFSSIGALRHLAVHRLSTSAQGIQKMLQSAVRLAVTLEASVREAFSLSELKKDNEILPMSTRNDKDAMEHVGESSEGLGSNCVSRKRKSEDDEENVQDTKGEALIYVSKKAKNEDEKVEGENAGPTTVIR